MADPIPFSFKCDARWDDMLGSGSKRLCTQCNTPVVDLSSLTKEEASAVLATPGVCVNYIVEDGEVVYGQKARGGVDPEGPRVRERSRVRARGRRLLRWASAAASVAAAGSLAVPGVAQAGAAAAEEDGSMVRLRDWVASWFVEIPAPPPIRLGGAPMPVDPPEPLDTGIQPPVEPVVRPPRRLGGKPKPPPPTGKVMVRLGSLDVPHVTVECDHLEQQKVQVDGSATFVLDADWTPQACTVRLPTAPPQEATVQLQRGTTAVCSMQDHGLHCR